MIWTVILAVILVFLVWDFARPNPSPVCGIYRLPGRCYYTKKWLFYFLLLLNAKREEKDKKAGNRSNKAGKQSNRKERGYGKTVTDPEQLEAFQELEDHPNAIDSVYFNGFGQDGTFFAMRFARRQNREGEIWLWLNVPEIGFFQHTLHPDTTLYNLDKEGRVGGGCRIEMLEPLRRWKVSYCGILRQGLCNDLVDKPEKYVNVKLSFNWVSMNDPFNFDKDLDKHQLADAIAREQWTSKFWKTLREGHQTHYEQVGELSGKIEIEGHPTRHMHLRSIRDHTFGVRNWWNFHRYVIHFIFVEESGIVAMVAAISMPETMSNLKTGYLMYANGHTFPVTGNSQNLWDVAETRDPPESYSFSFTAAGTEYRVETQAIATPIVYHYNERNSRILERLCTFKVNGKPARGITEYHFRNPEGPPVSPLPEPSVPLLTEPRHCDIVDHQNKLTLPFQQEACGSSQLVGGKGSQLALLTAIQDKVQATVPRGFCVTLAAFNQQVQCNIELEHGIEKILQASRQTNSDSLHSTCKDVLELFASCKITPSIEEHILRELHALFGEDHHQVSLAVRSSAAGEDGGEASSAGQMETYLGVRGRDKILEAVRKCWASAYTYQAVQYRRQHGQPIRTAVGVAIQEMVQSEVSGVLFTNDPVTGSVNRMVLDASYGLGEAVVSGKTTPDTIKLQRLPNNKLTIQERVIGDKSLKIIVTDNGTKEETSLETSRQCCLTDEQILQLCKIGIKLEQYYGSGRDVEWAICKDAIYLLQARPITTTEQETDEDFIHEFDSPVATGTERLTLGNIGEMMPGCITPLTGSLFWRAVDMSINGWMVDFAGGYLVQHCDKLLASFCGRLFINLTFTAQLSSNSLVFKKAALEMNLVGQILEDHTMDIIQSYGWTNKSFLSRLYIFLKFLWNHNVKVRKAEEWDGKLKTYTVGKDCTTAQELYSQIDRKLPDYFEVWNDTVTKSAQSGNWGGVVMGVVSGGKDVWTVDNYADVGLLLSHCQNVYSAEVPSAMQDLAKAIIECEYEEKFLSLDDKECVQLLKSAGCNSTLKKMFDTFIERHGHRCVREAEFLEKSWRAEPEKLVRVLKAILKSKAYLQKDIEQLSVEKALKSLKSPVTAFGKFLLRKWIVPKARHAVGQREWGKSIAIKMVDKFKEAYWRLSELLEMEILSKYVPGSSLDGGNHHPVKSLGYLPEGELMFFLTHREIGKLVKTRSARLISRAIRRRKVLPLQSKIDFPKNSIGRPQPSKQLDVDEERKTSFTLTGMPVSQGSVAGVARVVLSLEDADKIQRDDILIVCYTDVGWSPYFPLISGLVTEMGGLVSHGAVVAREYGLPCIVNVPNATQLIRTGDHIRIDGATGTINKLEDVTS